MSKESFIFSEQPSPPHFFAEIGTFFNKDIATGMQMIEQVARSRDAVKEVPVLLKGEILHTASICRETDTVERYEDREGQIHTENYKRLIERKVVPLERYAMLLSHAASLGLDFVLSVYDTEGAAFAVEQGAAMLKLASSNLKHTALHEDVARWSIPVAVDEGRAPLSAVATTIERLRNSGVDRILLEHSPDGHPAFPEAHNLRIIDSYRSCFGVPVGLSCHYAGEEMLYAATSLGYAALEKGLVPESVFSDQDVAHALPLERLPHVLKKIHDIYLAVAGEPRRPLNRVLRGNISTSAHMGLVTAKFARSGESLNRDTISFAFPVEDGIGVEFWDLVKGWKFRKDLPEGALVRWADLMPDADGDSRVP